MPPTDNEEIQAARDFVRQILALAIPPDAPAALTGQRADSDTALAPPTPRSFAGELEATLFQAFTELDTTQSNACAL
jgi:hypothetical protein